MNPCSLLALAVLLATSSPPLALAFEDLCAVHGPCDDLERAYASVVQGEACRSFYASGQCSGLCTRSLKAMLGRHLWRKCAERCDWPGGLVAAADSWLDMCVSRPAPGADQPEKLEIVSHRGQKIPDPEYEAMLRGELVGGVAAAIPIGRRDDPAGAAGGFKGVDSGGDGKGAGEIHGKADREVGNRVEGGSSGIYMASGSQQDSSRGSAAHRRGIGVARTIFRIVFAICALGAIVLSASQGGTGAGIFRTARVRLRGTRIDATPGLPALNPTGGTGRVRRDLASLQRGARRHLKGVRSTVD